MSGSFAGVGASGHLEKCCREVAVAVGMLVEIVLVTFVGGEEGAEGLDLDGEGVAVAVLHLSEDLVDDGAILGVDVVDTSAIARSLVFALPVDGGGLDAEEVEVEELAEGQDVGVEDHADGFGIARAVGVDLLIVRVFGVAVGEACLGFKDAVDLLEIVLDAPEAAASKEYRLGHVSAS